MQFIKDGPDIPETLLQAREEGRVVFFCGAGISYPAGLPDFKGLVDQIYETVGEKRDAVETLVYEKALYDATLDLLERRLPGQRAAVRKALATVLKPKLRRKGATETHEALLLLAQSRTENGKSKVRLVTTNFDRIFQHLISRSKPVIPIYSAPLLPIPKNSRWDGVVYLHGLLSDNIQDETALQNLVLTSGDFGLAYLTDRWASRFVSELFRNYIVCFVGYSINDPVLRYMMDALAADRMLGEHTPQAYAFGDFQLGQEKEKTLEWEAKGVTPILYEISKSGAHNHFALHQTLKTWAATYRDGLQGKESIVVEYAMTRPTGSTTQDDFVGRLLWALSDESGLPAKRFADFDPVPPLDWLKPLSEKRYGHEDLIRFGVTPQKNSDDNLKFSLIQRPTPYTKSSWIGFVASEVGGGYEDRILHHLGRWLTRHLNDPTLIFWLANQGEKIHPQLVKLIGEKLDEISQLTSDGKVDELKAIRANAVNAIPNSWMQGVWRMLLSGRMKSSSPFGGLDQWRKRVSHDGLTTTLRLEFAELLAPKISLKPRIFPIDETVETSDIQKSKSRINSEMVLAEDGVQSSLNEFSEFEKWRIILPDLLNDTQKLLRDALDLRRDLAGMDDFRDNVYWDLPSISQHQQNYRYCDWVALIELLRDAWVATLKTNSVRAIRIAQDWFSEPYPTFKRLALFAATYEGVMPHGAWVDWLLADDSWWLWTIEVQRETMRLLVLQGKNLSIHDRARLEAAMLAGPPRDRFGENIDPEEWQATVEESVWIHLAKLAASGGALGDDAAAKLEELSRAHPDWKVKADERDEFPYWMTNSSDPDYQHRRVIIKVPRQKSALLAWLRLHPSNEDRQENDWYRICQEDFRTAARALRVLANENIWPIERWREALRVWCDESLVACSWRHTSTCLQRMPNTEFLEIAASTSRWLEIGAKKWEGQDVVFFALCRRLLTMPYQEESDLESTVNLAINQPVGHTTQALLNHLFHHPLTDGQGLPTDVNFIFTDLCKANPITYRHARVLLSAHCVTLFRVDPEWTKKNLLPYYSWQPPATEARAFWKAFLWSPRLNRPLYAVLKTEFLETAHHYEDLGDNASRYAAILVYIALDTDKTFTFDELRKCTKALPDKGLVESVKTLIQALEGAGEQKEEYWENRIKPYWQYIWPKSVDRVSELLSEQLALLAIAAGREFPSALEMFKDWLKPLRFGHTLVNRLKESNHCTKFPKPSLILLSKIIKDSDRPPPNGLSDCLNTIHQSWPEAQENTDYIRLRQYMLQHQ